MNIQKMPKISSTKKNNKNDYIEKVSKLINATSVVIGCKHKAEVLFQIVSRLPESSCTSATQYSTTQYLKELSTLKKESKLDGFSYMKRLTEYSDFPASVLIMTGFSYLRVLCSPKVATVEKSMTLKIFAACLNISQKLIMDDDWVMEDFASLTGFKKKNIAQLEQFLLNEILGFKLFHTSKVFRQFKRWLLQLETHLQEMKEKKKLEPQTQVKRNKRSKRRAMSLNKNIAALHNPSNQWKIRRKHTQKDKFVIKTFQRF